MTTKQKAVIGLILLCGILLSYNLTTVLIALLGEPVAPLFIVFFGFFGFIPGVVAVWKFMSEKLMREQASLTERIGAADGRIAELEQTAVQLQEQLPRATEINQRTDNIRALLIGNKAKAINHGKIIQELLALEDIARKCPFKVTQDGIRNYIKEVYAMIGQSPN